MKKKVSSSKKKASKKTVSKKTAGKSSKKAGVAPENSFLIRGGRLVTMDADERVIEADLLVVDGKIQKIAKRIPKTKAARVIEAKGKIVLPGFVQGHVHACHGLFR
ncbi:hypothetical protein KAI87_12580, partial [Myxococcota bacterium]|nr:hypothetical protein [Myxococcota bacterium]